MMAVAVGGWANSTQMTVFFAAADGAAMAVVWKEDEGAAALFAVVSAAAFGGGAEPRPSVLRLPMPPQPALQPRGAP